jgi:hypothetical protein
LVNRNIVRIFILSNKQIEIMTTLDNTLQAVNQEFQIGMETQLGLITGINLRDNGVVRVTYDYTEKYSFTLDGWGNFVEL